VITDITAWAPRVGVETACAAFGVAPRTWRHHRAKRAGELPARPSRATGRLRRPHPAKLDPAEEQVVLDVLCSDRFADAGVAEVYATLLDEGIYHCSESTMHRILRDNHAAGERRRQATHPPRKRPELMATGRGQVWSWDITKLRGPVRGVYYDLYVVLDIFSRFVVAWTIAAREDSEIAKTILEEAMGVHGIPEAIPADRGNSMTFQDVPID